MYIPTSQDICTQFQEVGGPGRVKTLCEFSWANQHTEGMNPGVLDAKLPEKMAVLCSGAKNKTINSHELLAKHSSYVMSCNVYLNPILVTIKSTPCVRCLPGHRTCDDYLNVMQEALLPPFQQVRT